MATRAEIEAYIRQAAAARGLDPDFAVKVAKGESGLNPNARLNTAKEDSKGIWQLNTKNGLGVEALKRGIDPGDPNQWQQQTDFALDQAKKSWRPWTVARNLMTGRETPAGASATPRKDGAPGPADVPVLPNSGVDKGLLAIREFKNEVEAKQQQQAHQQAIDQGQEQMARQQEQAAQPMSPTAPLAAPPPAPAPSEAADFAALMLPRIRRGLLADPRDYGGLLGG